MRRGFTLLEVIVALAIFALAAIVLGAAYVNVLVAYADAQRTDPLELEVRFARSQFLATTDRDQAEKGSDYQAPDGRRVQWHAKIEATVLPDLFQVTFVCEVGAGSGSPTEKAKTVTETFTVLRPTWADPVENSKIRQDVQDRIKELQGRKGT
ncbi:MAG: prepilin-type N-terminal cleavage/methylation domain-containing protein [Verrucomicrobia bacterium]|nr:prepilin-type N-terminal cleavage/methylation domain-containing protein [Verrucomicrobiota bacterium]